jgi:hypothetical protein
MGANESVVNKRTMIDSVSEAATPKHEKRNELLFAGSCVVSCHHRPICIAFSRSISTLTAIVLLKKQLERERALCTKEQIFLTPITGALFFSFSEHP